MKTMQEILPKLKDIISKELGNKKVYDKDVADILNIKQLTFATMKQRGKIPYPEILDFCAKKRISINWLFYDQIVQSLEEETNKFVNVRYYRDIYASAGGGAFNDDENFDYIKLDETMVEKLGGMSEVKYLESINVIGDSMEPTFEDGDIVFLNRNKKDVSRGGIFVVSTNNGLFIKRVSYKTNGTLDLISDNSAYTIETVDLNSVEIVGKVTGVVSRL